MQAELDYLPQERAMQEQRMKMAEMAGLGQVLEPLAYGGNPAIFEILRSRGILPENFGQPQATPQDEAMKQAFMQYMQQKGR